MCVCVSPALPVRRHTKQIGREHSQDRDSHNLTSTIKLQRCKSQLPREPVELHKPEANFAGVMQAVLLDMGLEVGGAAHGPALRAAVWGLVSVDPLVGTVTALVGQHHLAHLARLMEERLH